MNLFRAHRSTVQWAVLVLLGVFLAGCATPPKIDWTSRVGTYTYEQAVLELGPPDKSAKLSDGTTVAEWLVRQGYTQVSGPYYGFAYYGFTPWYYGGYYPPYYDSYPVPARWLRLVFNPESVLKDWKLFYK